MYIKEIKNQEIKVAIPLTKGTDKTRIKKRSILNEYGIPVSTKSEPFSQSCYVEWQIGYDVVTSDSEKLEKTTLKDLRFIGANGKEKALYELSEYIKYFYDWNVITRQELIDVKTYLQNMTDNDFLDNSIAHPELAIKRTNFVQKQINGFNFMWTQVEYPLLVYKFGNFEIVTEIIIKEKQYAIGIQPMLFLCFPITELENSDEEVYENKMKEFKELYVNELPYIGLYFKLNSVLTNKSVKGEYKSTVYEPFRNLINFYK